MIKLQKDYMHKHLLFVNFRLAFTFYLIFDRILRTLNDCCVALWAKVCNVDSQNQKLTGIFVLEAREISTG